MKTHLVALCLTTLLSAVDADMEGAVTDLGYDSYSTAWRYLGSYIDDCSTSSKWYSSCTSGTRKLLWAAYYDPNYEGEQIGEYQYYTSDGEWDDSTCTGDRCAKMDCHDPYTEDSSWELLGVYKESVSFDNDNFFEQLFKHQVSACYRGIGARPVFVRSFDLSLTLRLPLRDEQGYCLWDGDKEDNDYGSQDSDAWQDSNYWFMQTMRKELPEGCTQTSGFSGTYYIAMKPQEGGDMTLGVYTDSSCSTEADYTYEDYQSYATSLTATASSGAFDTWNAGMDAYKICQPCRAYNREATECSGEHCDRRRRLGEEEDGQGDEEQNGFNCYDDAGYQNCNQCYKFETHTDMEEADASDLSLADSQGTILLIEYDDVWYGSGLVGDVEEPEEEEEPEDEHEEREAEAMGSSMGSAGAYGGHYAGSAGGSDAGNGAGTSHSNAYGAVVGYSFAGVAALLALGGALVVARRGARQGGTLDGDIYVAAPR